MGNQKNSENDLWSPLIKEVCKNLWKRVVNELGTDCDELVSEAIRENEEHLMISDCSCNALEELGYNRKDEYIVMDLLRRKALNRLGSNLYYDTIDPFGELTNNISGEKDSWDSLIEVVCRGVWGIVGDGLGMSANEVVSEEIMDYEYNIELEGIKQNDTEIEIYWRQIIDFEDKVGWDKEEKRFLVNEEGYMMKDMLRRKVLNRVGTGLYFDTIDPCGGLKQYGY